ncbi:hypothetical protein PCANC_17161 [Puccinia coronata f. sp. avenae]|uniref:Uncharacterized protein n=1 Tax=Puccinia coronata f. sp. avenae TaxID=200324 RepID=A0A2N5UIY1_9BASI|nr:hypothetical protein PCANC_17161 [Puccinia coronata f. sp. avenae]
MLPPAKTKESVLGFFPVLGKVLEEDKEQTANLELASETKKQNNSTITCDDSLDVDEASESKYGNANNKLSDDASETQPGEDANDDKAIVQKQSTSHSKTTRLQDLTNKLDVVIKLITQSAAQQASFNHTSKKLNFKVSLLISGYSIRWNIKYQSRQKAIEAREVIECLLKEDQEQNKAGVFDNIWFTPCNWKEIKKWN